MGAFFRGDRDLFLEVMKDKEGFLAKSVLSLRITGRMDLEEDVKDAVVQIASSGDFSSAEPAVSSLMSILEDGFGISITIDKRN